MTGMRRRSMPIHVPSRRQNALGQRWSASTWSMRGVPWPIQYASTIWRGRLGLHLGTPTPLWDVRYLLLCDGAQQRHCSQWPIERRSQSGHGLGDKQEHHCPDWAQPLDQETGDQHPKWLTAKGDQTE